MKKIKTVFLLLIVILLTACKFRVHIESEYSYKNASEFSEYDVKVNDYLKEVKGWSFQ